MGEEKSSPILAMPIYQYECSEGHRFESFNAMERRNEMVCPVCNNSCHILPSIPNMRIAEPLKWVHGGKVVKWIPDGGIIPKSGTPYPPERSSF